ncbi:MAG: hypothetical protein ACTSVV_17810 [Promethearchaeota archaeon]
METYFNASKLGYSMSERRKKNREPLWRLITAQNKEGMSFFLGEMKVLYPFCVNPIVGEFGSRKRKKGRVEAFQCKNLWCPPFIGSRNFQTVYYNYFHSFPNHHHQ